MPNESDKQSSASPTIPNLSKQESLGLSATFAENVISSNDSIIDDPVLTKQESLVLSSTDSAPIIETEIADSISSS